MGSGKKCNPTATFGMFWDTAETRESKKQSNVVSRGNRKGGIGEKRRCLLRGQEENDQNNLLPIKTATKPKRKERGVN